MEKYYKRKKEDIIIQETQTTGHVRLNVRPRIELNLDELPIDPAKRKNIYDLDANDREKIRRFYLQKGPCQPKMSFPWRICGGKKRRFIYNWFKEHPSWLEYSVSTDSSYCLFCYLFKPECGGQSGGDVFVTQGFTNWKEGLGKFKEHVGDINSVHNKCMRACQDLMNEKQHVEVVMSNQSEQSRIDYHTRLVASIDVARLCLSQALAFRGHDESEESTKKGNFVTFLQFLADHNDKFVDILEKQVEELNDRFSEIGTDLLLGMSCLDPQNSFRAFDKEKLIKFARLYPSEFSPMHIMELEWALPVYFEDVRLDDRFSTLNGIAGLGQKMVETGKHLIHPLVFLLIKLAMLLPVATAGVERSFSAMNIVKNRLRNRIGDEWLNDLLVTYVERDIFLSVKTEDVIQRFQNMKPRRIAL